ncbi:ATP-binding cassette domain-containing protein [Vibrio sp. MA40-2]|uniref:ATP-binding cassette domain-containing protein n=1 Tax=Vibrio sp. MA40-2 TaxID=3391828 RepID=UPI0039A4045E
MLAVNNLCLTDSHSGTLFKNVSFQLSANECIGFIGASGSGKSLLAHALLNSIPADTYLTGEVVVKETIALMPQSATYLNPTSKVQPQILRRQSHRCQPNQKQAFKLTENILQKYPGQLSGGMTKLVLAMMAIVQESKFIIADEPTTGLDPKQANLILETLSSFKRHDKGVIIISHDICELVEHVDRIIVFLQGEIVDITDKKQLISGHCHPYTKKLWQASPKNWGNSRYDKTA